jgi:DNA polymerase IV
VSETLGRSRREADRGASSRPRRILHLDLDPFFVNVERSLDASLRGRPVIVGGTPDGKGMVAAASAEARAAGVRSGQSVDLAKHACPDGVFRPGDLDTYARFSEDVSAILLGASRRVERPSADEAYVDLSRESVVSPNPVAAAESIKDEIQRRLGLDASLGLASTRLAARVASTWARPRGLLVVLPGYETSFLARQPLSFLPDLPPHLETALESAGFLTLGHVAEAEEETLAAVVGNAAPRLRDAARGVGEDPVPITAPPAWVQEDAVIRDRSSDREALGAVVEGLAGRACRRLRPFGLSAGTVTVEVRRADGVVRRDFELDPGLTDADTTAAVARNLAEPLLDPVASVRGVQVRLSRLTTLGSQAPLFPESPGVAGHH